MLQKIIEEIIQPLFVDTATWVEKYGGLVQTLEVKTTIDPSTGKQQVQKWPISCDVNQTECNEPSDTYRALVPDDSKASILYFEEVQPMTFAGFLNNTSGGIMRNWQKYTGRVRLVVWLNAARLGVGDQNGNYTCDWSYPFLDQMLKLINIKGKATSGTFAGGWYDIRPRGIVRKDLGIFSKYTFDKYKNYYRYPFDYFAVNFDVNMEFCVGKNTVIPTGAVINCPFTQIDAPFINEYSLYFDGIDEYLTIPDSPTLSFGNGTTDTGMTYSVWIRRMGTGATSFLLNKSFDAGGGASGDSEYRVSLNSAGFLFFTVFSQLTNNNFVSGISTIAVPADTWVHIALTWDGSTMKYYLNAVEQGLTVSTTGTYVAMQNGTGIVNIGRPWDSRFYYRGWKDELALFNIALDASGVAALIDGTTPADLSDHPNFANCVLWLRNGDGDTWSGTQWELTDNSNETNNALSINMEEVDRTTEVPT